MSEVGKVRKCVLCGVLLVYVEGCGLSVRDLKVAGVDKRLCRECERSIVSGFLAFKGLSLL